MSGLEERLLDRMRERRFERHPPGWLARLALLPLWTAAVSRALDFGPVPDSDLVESTTALSSEGLEERTFWLRESVRAELGAYLMDHHSATLQAALDDLRGRIAPLVARLDELPRPDRELLMNWRTSVQGLEDPSGTALLRTVSHLVSDGRLPEAARLVATVRAVGEVLGEPLTGAARRAGWHLERAGRQAEDIHYLRHYQRRPALERNLLGLNDEQWAVHLLGPGGAGKTMLIRGLGMAAPDPPIAALALRPLDGVIAGRVDFDHLDPRYPEDRPGELFLALAVDLLGFVESRRTERSYRRFLDTVDALHEEMARTRRLADRVDEAADRMIVAFADFLIDLPRPVLLILDTCEELAKLYPPGEPATGIDRTFHLLERLHDLLPTVRVLFAGRRWLVPPPPGGPAGPLLRTRPYLRVVHVGGFTSEEARAYLAARDVPGRFTEAVLGRAASPGGYNPFDLAAYADWVPAEPSIDPDELLAAPGDPYIEQRIIGRIRDPAVVRCLGVVAELGRLDRVLAHGELTRLGVDADAVIETLSTQEWTRVGAYTPDGRPAVVELEENLRTRLRAVTAADPGRFPLHRERIGAAAAALADGAASVTGAAAHTVLVALRMSPAGEAVAFWQRVEDRVVAEGAWGWAEQVTARAAAELSEAELSEAEPPATDSVVLASVLATQAATRIHTGGGGVAALWRQVGALIHFMPREPLSRSGSGQRGRPDPGEGSVELVLLDRARLGRIAAGDELDFDLPSWLPRMVAARTAPAGSLLAAVESWMRRDNMSDLQAPNVAAIAGLTDDAGTKALAGALAALVAIRQEQPDPASFLPSDPLRDPRPWADLVAPPSIRAYVDLARLLVACETGGPLLRDAGVQMALRHLTGPKNPNESYSLDAERLRSLSRLVLRSLTSDVHTWWPAVVTQDDIHPDSDRSRPLTWAQRQVRPLVVTFADMYVTTGYFDDAAQMLQRRLEEAVADSDDPEMVEQCQLALLRLCRRDRDLRHYPGAVDLARFGSPRCRAEAWITLTLVTGDQPGSPEEAGSWHGWWQCQDVTTLQEDRFPPVRAEDGIPPELSSQSAAEHAAFFGGHPLPTPSPHPLLRHLPWARGVEALEAAEVFALRFPQQAHSLLVAASEDLRHDRVRRWQTALLAAIAASRARVDNWPKPPLEDNVPVSSGWALRQTGLDRLEDALTRSTLLLPELTPPPEPTPHPLQLPEPLYPYTGEPPKRRRIRLTSAGVAAALAGLVVTVFVTMTALIAGTGGSAGPGNSTAASHPISSAPSYSDNSDPGTPEQTPTATRSGNEYTSAPARTTAPTAPTAPPSQGAPWWLWLGLGGVVLAGSVWVALRTRRTTDAWELIAYRSRAALGPAWGSADVVADGNRPEIVRVLVGREHAPGDPRESALFALHRRLPATFRSIHDATALEATEGTYVGPEHLRSSSSMSPYIHLVGVPVDTSDGIRIRVDAGRLEVTTSFSGMSQGGAVYVLQAEPSDDKAYPLTEDDREGFVRFATMLCAGGSPAVLIVPSLPDTAARQVTDLCADWPYGENVLCAENLLTLQLRIREIVAEARGGRAAECDVILFLPTDRGDAG